jgi:hypothetical protein
MNSFAFQSDAIHTSHIPIHSNTCIIRNHESDIAGKQVFLRDICFSKGSL